ncbi:hypothetical protein HH308_05825 [Gordonia sp. TBRC 11910]|uniref:Mce/MlaD domain-containing protein n=1 Tax=Gordonia asplenii TaxID=2725283 RepID=A0A848KW98_9ACTN|nr:MlaD family protein [Gordonia asplenii]NMO00733.1 hypothetical protein [Gordonia asplenii]
MTDFRTPGMAASPATFAKRAVIAIIVTAILVIGAVVVTAMLPDDNMHIAMHTDVVAGGIEPGTAVVLNGDEIGQVASVRADGTKFVVGLTINPAYRDRKDVLTSAMQVTYAPKNLFGIGAVELTAQPGGDPLSNDADFYPDTPVDSTLTTLLRGLSDLQTEAFAPYVSDILSNANKATMGLLPVIGTVSELATEIADTQKLPTSVTMPQMAALLSGLNATTVAALPGLRSLMSWQAAQRPGFIDKANDGLGAAYSTLLPIINDILGKDIGQTMPLVPALTQIVARIQQSFPDSYDNGLEIAALIERIRRAMPAGADGRPMLNVDVVLRGIPGVTAALTSPTGGHR